MPNDDELSRLAAVENRASKPIHTRLRTQPLPRAAFVTALVICVGVSVQIVSWHNTTEAQEEYITGISSRIPASLRPGLRQHVYCAVFRDIPEIPPAGPKLEAQIGSQYAGLIDVMRSHVPDSYRVVDAHQCRHGGDQFVHIVLTDGRKRMSLLLNKRETTSSPNNIGLTVATGPGSATPLYSASADRYQIAAFESNNFFAYLVSEVSREQNLTIATAIVLAVQHLLS
jgi:hypothetical protein